jgi:hypothetical protein
VEGVLQYRHPLYAARQPVLALNEWSIQATLGVSPAAFRPGVRLTIQPLSILRIWVGYDGEGYFGTAGFARSFPSPASDYHRDLLGSPAAGPTGAYPLWVNEAELGVRLQVTGGPWLARSSWQAIRYQANLQRGDRVLYDPGIDNLVYANGWALHSDTDLGYALTDGETNSGPILGARFSLNFVFYPGDAYAPGAPHTNANSPSARVGPWLRFPLLTPDRARAVNDLSLTVLTQFYIVDRFHTGASTSAAVPFVGLLLTATGDL